MDTVNHTQINLLIRPRLEGRAAPRYSGIQFTAEHNERLNDSFNLFAARIYRSDMTLATGTRTFELAQDSPGVVSVNGDVDLAVNPAGEPLIDIYDPELVYIKTPVTLNIAMLDDDGNGPLRLPNYLWAGGVLLVTSPSVQTGDVTFAGLTITAQDSEITAYEAASGQTFYIDFIYSGRGSV